MRSQCPHRGSFAGSPVIRTRIGLNSAFIGSKCSVGRIENDAALFRKESYRDEGRMGIGRS